MRVLIVSNTYPPADISGVGALAYELARQLDESGHGVRVLTRRPPADDAYAVAVGGPKLLFPLAAAWRYLRLAPSRFDVVHVHESDGVLVALATRLWRLLGRTTGRLVATLQVSYRRERLAVRPLRVAGEFVSRPSTGEWIFAWLRAPLHALLGRLSARLADAVVAPSAVTAGELEADYGARDVHVIPNGVALPPSAEAGAAPSGPKSARKARPFTILFAGRLRTRKAVAVLLVAFARLRRAHPESVLDLIGDGELRAALEAQAESLSLSEQVRFHGRLPRSEVVRRYAGADVFCLPSTYEGFPVAILEAMAAGLPVVASRVSGIPEAVDDGVSGLLVPAVDAGALADALATLAADPERRRAMGEAAQRAVAERFTIGDVGQRYLELWNNLVAEAPADGAGSEESTR